MSELWISLAELPEHGQEFEVCDQEVWMAPIREFNIPATVSRKLWARMFLFPGQNGYLIKGVLGGAITLPCNRCSASVEVGLDAPFELFEEFEPEEEVEKGSQSLLRFSQGFPELNLGGVLFEQFQLNLPVKPLCLDNCQGLCPKCGQDLNLGSCACDLREPDPRMEVFRNLKIDP